MGRDGALAPGNQHRKGPQMPPESHFTGLDLFVLVLYFTLTMGIGAYFYVKGKSRNTEGYTAAGRSLPGIVVGLSILATFLSSISFLALPGNAVDGNWNRFVFSLSLPIAAFIAVRYFVPFYRSRGEVSAYHHLEVRFGPWARLYTGITYLVMQMVRIGAVTFLMALPLNALLGWDIWIIILITGVSVTLYSLIGGLVAVIWADAIQSVILLAGAFTCLAIMLFGLPEGPGQVFAIAGEYNKFSLGGFGPSLFTDTFWVVLIYGVFINLTNFGIDQNYVQRYVASKSDREASKSVWLGALLYIPVSAVFFFIGTALFAFYAAQPELLPLENTPPSLRAVHNIEPLEPSPPITGDRVFPYFIVSQLPPGLTGLLIAAIFAAAMSTTSTSLNSSATILMTDVYKRYIRPDANEKQTMLVLYGATLVWGLLGTLVAIGLIWARGILDAWWTLQGILAGGMLGLFLLGMISRRATSGAAAIGVVVGVLVIAWLSLSPMMGFLPEALQNPFHNLLTIVLGTMTIILVGMLVTSLITGGGIGAEEERP